MKLLANLNKGVEGCFSHMCQYMPKPEREIEFVQDVQASFLLGIGVSGEQESDPESLSLKNQNVCFVCEYGDGRFECGGSWQANPFSSGSLWPLHRKPTVE